VERFVLGCQLGSIFHRYFWFHSPGVYWAVCCVERHDGQNFLFGGQSGWLSSWAACWEACLTGCYVGHIVRGSMLCEGAWWAAYCLHWTASWIACCTASRVGQFIREPFVFDSQCSMLHIMAYCLRFAGHVPLAWYNYWWSWTIS
jgi:hypothetical protein